MIALPCSERVALGRNDHARHLEEAVVEVFTDAEVADRASSGGAENDLSDAALPIIGAASC